MTDFRRLERELTEFLEAAGVDIIRDAGDVFAVVASFPDCGRPRNCEARFVSDGKVDCHCCDLHGIAGGDVMTLSITKLAERLSSE